ncbi:MAG: hypothetical protein IPL95_03205, partial [Saprospiraceae bacterium]|nr:hypothetical protein [Saprospiraceae bacterium]
MNMLTYQNCCKISAIVIFFVSQFSSTNLLGQGEFKTKWFFPSSSTQINFKAEAVDSVDYFWTTAPSGKNGKGRFMMNTSGDIQLNGLDITAGDTLQLDIAPINLRHFYFKSTEDAS